MFIAAYDSNKPIAIYTHVFDKTTDEDISNVFKNPHAYAISEWDTITKEAEITVLDEDHRKPVMVPDTMEVKKERIHLPNAKTVFIIPNKNMAEVFGYMASEDKEGYVKANGTIDLLSIEVAEAMSEEGADVEMRSTTDYKP